MIEYHKINSEDDREGPRAFSTVPFINTWTGKEDFVMDAHDIFETIGSGGFDINLIERRVGNYEDQILAIRSGWVDAIRSVDDGPYGPPRKWIINEKGKDLLRSLGKPVPTFLPVTDGWHGTPARYCAYEESFRSGEKFLRLFKEAIPFAHNLAMKPVLSKQDVIALRDYLNDFLNRNVESGKE